MQRPWTVEGALLAVRVGEGDERTLGRADVRDDDARLSRAQVRLTCRGGRLSVRREGKNPSVVRRASGAEAVLEAGADLALADGDELLLLPDLHRFVVRAPAKRPAPSDAPDAAKRARTATLAELAAVVPHAAPAALDAALEMCAGRADLAAELLLSQAPAAFAPAAAAGAGARRGANESASTESAATATESAARLYRLTAVSGREEAGTVRLAGLVRREGLEAALLTTFMADLEWLLRAAPALAAVPLLLVHGQEPAPELPPAVRNVTMLRPRMPMSYGVCHGKCFVLFYATHVRLVVSTANLLEADYERKTQGVWFQDFARRAAGEGPSVFEDTLVDYLRRTGVPPQWLVRVRQFSFAAAQAVLLSSVPGIHAGDALHRYGHMQLRRALAAAAECGAIRESRAPVVCQASSMGALHEAWLAELLTSFSADAAVPKARVAELARIVWPTAEFVRNCIDGYLAGSSICLHAKNVKPFARPLLCRYEPPQPTRRDVPPHIKSYCRPDAAGSTPFVVLTSANVSMSAWGRLQLAGKQLAVNNFELGVLFLPSRLALPGAAPPRLVMGAHAAEAPDCLTFPAPSRVPPARYGGGDAPWVQDEPHLKPDVHGFVDRGADSAWGD